MKWLLIATYQDGHEERLEFEARALRSAWNWSVEWALSKGILVGMSLHYIQQPR